MTVSDHARLAPSAAHRWGPDACALSVTMQQLYPEDEESEAAREGTAAHEVVAEMLAGRLVDAGDTATNGVSIDRDMVDSARDFVRMMREEAGALAIRSEEKVTITSVHRDCAGTPDVYWIDRDEQRVWVRDYKYGHRYVDVYRNFQLILYAIGVLECEGFNWGEWNGWTIHLGIYQPRCYHPEGTYRTWTLGGTELTNWCDRLAATAIMASERDPKATTGSHCRDCPGLLHCDAAIRSGLSAVDWSFKPRPLDLTPRQLGVLLYWVTQAHERLSVIKDALEEQGTAMVRQGQDVLLWRGDYSSGKEGWTVPPEQVFALGDMLGIDVRKPAAPLTPSQARKAGIPGDMVGVMSNKPRGSLRLVPVTERYVSRAFGGELT